MFQIRHLQRAVMSLVNQSHDALLAGRAWQEHIEIHRHAACINREILRPALDARAHRFQLYQDIHIVDVPQGVHRTPSNIVGLARLESLHFPNSGLLIDVTAD